MSTSPQLRKVTKIRSQFTTDDDAYKLLYLAICDIEKILPVVRPSR